MLESPQSKYLKNDLFNSYISNLKIKLELVDFKYANGENFKEEWNEYFDIIIFTEIAEHLDHSTLIKSLITIRSKLKNSGILIVTTPNLVSISNRIRFLCGNGDV